MCAKEQGGHGLERAEGRFVFHCPHHESFPGIEIQYHLVPSPAKLSWPQLCVKRWQITGLPSVSPTLATPGEARRPSTDLGSSQGVGAGMG